MRLDKFLCDMNIGTRSQVKSMIQKGLVLVNQMVAVKAQQQVQEGIDTITVRGQEIVYQKFFYYMLNKPAGVVSATEDNVSKTVLELLPKEKRNGIFPIGRLDKDTEGLLLLTNDGELTHRLLSPKKHVEKVYYVELGNEISEGAVRQLEQGVDIGEKNRTLPAKVTVESSKIITLTICEGKFHQVKRMLQAVNNSVVYLKRINFGGIALDEALDKGQWRELSLKEIERLTYGEERA